MKHEDNKTEQDALQSLLRATCSAEQYKASHGNVAAVIQQYVLSQAHLDEKRLQEEWNAFKFIPLPAFIVSTLMMTANAYAADVVNWQTTWLGFQINDLSVIHTLL